jgi:ubiquinone/menaquinone biosynthesis C-methylase UbiE
MTETLYSGDAYFEKHPEWHVGEARWKADHVYAMLQQHQLNPLTICEIGCGAGEILNQLYQRFPESVTFTGIEIAPRALELAKKREKDRLRFYLQSVEDLPADQNFELCLIMDVFEHVEDYYGFLKEVKKHGKNFVFHIPLDLSAQTVIRDKPLSRKRKNVGHIHYFTRTTALESLIHCGFEITDWKYTASYVELPAKSTLARIARLPRKILYSVNPEFAVKLLGGYSLLVLAR